jgi:hypothetical protein
MAKRRKKRPNIPKATLDRARRQAGLTPASDETPDESDATADDSADADSDGDSTSATPAQTSVERAAQRRQLSLVQLERSRRKGELNSEMIQELLANPTDYVSEEQLHEEYEHVLIDLRNMGVLAAALMVLLVALAQFI